VVEDGGAEAGDMVEHEAPDAQESAMSMITSALGYPDAALECFLAAVGSMRGGMSRGRASRPPTRRRGRGRPPSQMPSTRFAHEPQAVQPSLKGARPLGAPGADAWSGGDSSNQPSAPSGARSNSRGAYCSKNTRAISSPRVLTSTFSKIDF